MTPGGTTFGAMSASAQYDHPDFDATEDSYESHSMVASKIPVGVRSRFTIGHDHKAHVPKHQASMRTLSTSVELSNAGMSSASQRTGY